MSTEKTNIDPWAQLAKQFDQFYKERFGQKAGKKNLRLRTTARGKSNQKQIARTCFTEGAKQAFLIAAELAKNWISTDEVRRTLRLFEEAMQPLTPEKP